MNLNNMYFHGLAGTIDLANGEKAILETSLKQLEDIFNAKGIYSRNKLIEFNIQYQHKPVENGRDFISICVANPSEEEFSGKNEGLESAFINYVYNSRIAFLIDKNIESKYEFRNPNGTGMIPGERQVKDQIGIDDFLGILVTFQDENIREEAITKIKELMEKYKVELPIYDKDFNEIIIPKL